MRIIFRADGNSHIGLGHVMRLVALAEMLKPDFNIYLAIQEPTTAVAQVLAEGNIRILALLSEKDLHREADWLIRNLLKSQDVLVLDGYGFDTLYQEKLRPHAARIICLDDIHAFPFVADVVVNPAGGIATGSYQLDPHTKLFTGPDYALLQAPYLAIAQQERHIQKIERVFINFGGADPQNYTLWVIEALENSNKEFSVEVVVGSAYQHLSTLQTYGKEIKNLAINLHQNVSAGEMCRIMSLCDAAICAPSTVAYEWCCVGGPLFIHRTVENQINMEKFLLQESIAFPFLNFSEIINNPEFPEWRARQSKQQRNFFHGQSKAKWRDLFIKTVYPVWLSLREARLTDSDKLFNWINDPEVRRHSLNPAPVPQDIHISWFRKKIQDENSFIFIAEIEDKAIGMIRFDLTGPEALISYLLDKHYRGKGLGTSLLKKGIAALINLNKSKTNKITGLVQKQNIPSVKAFEHAGFSPEEYSDTRHPNLIKFSLALTEAGTF